MRSDVMNREMSSAFPALRGLSGGDGKGWIWGLKGKEGDA